MEPTKYDAPPPRFDAPMYDDRYGAPPPPIQQQPVSTHHSSTTVVVQQPISMQQPGHRAWSSELCACFNDMTSCCLVFFCPCCYEMYLWQRAGESCCGPLCIFNSALVLRTKFRTEHKIHGSIMNDCFTTACCCYPCVLCQLSREMDFVERTGLGPDGGSPMRATIQ
ncbi:cornifelin homolog B-like [Ptychodera flava]|uniref:cornifelin homolog B-like n=1 Tax=Ptychodera flava TaxID=63121 RepID=UPI00396A5CB2